MFTWCYCLNVTLLAGLHICIPKSNDCISTFLKSHKIPLLPFREGSPVQTMFRQGKHRFLKTHPSNQREDLQNSIKAATNSRKTAMALKASTHTHRELLFLPQNSTQCHLQSPCQGHTMPPSLCQTSIHGCCWGRDLPLWERAGRELQCMRYKGRKDLFLLPG